MIVLEKLYKNRRTMRAVFGLDEAKFNELVGRMDALWLEVLASREGRIGIADDIYLKIRRPTFL